MADQIVSCNGCGRKYKVREGSPPGEFECTNCGESVSYGAAPPAAQAKPVTARGVAPPRGAPGAPPRGARGAVPARPARGPGRGPARGPARGRGSYSRGRGGGRAPARGARGGYDEADMGYGPPPKQNTGLYILLGVLAVLIVGGGIAVVALSGGDDEPAPRTIANQQNPQPESPKPYVPPAEPAPGPEMDGGTQDPAPADTGGGRAGMQPRPGPGGETDSGGGSASDPDPAPGDSGSRRPGRSSRRPLRGAPPSDADIPENLQGADVMLLKRMTVEQFMAREVPHFDDTPADLKADIDKLCSYLVDYSAASKQMRAAGQLARLGRPAVPRILGSFGKITGDWEKDEGRSIVCSVDDTLWSILQRRYPDSYMVKLSPMSSQSKEILEENVRRWFVWWYSEGFALESYAPEGEEEDEEDG